MANKPAVKLLGTDGNALAIIGACQKAAKKDGWDKERIDKMVDEMMNGDYNNVLQIAMREFEVS